MLLLLRFNLEPAITPTTPTVTVDTHDGVGGFRQSRRTAKALEEARRKRWEEEVADVRALADQLRGLPVQVGALERVEQVIAQPAVREPAETVPEARWDEWLAELDRVRQDVRALLQRLEDEAQEWEEAAMLVALMDGATPEFPPNDDEIEYRMLMEAL